MGISQVALGGDRRKPADLDAPVWPRASDGACRSRDERDDRLPLDSAAVIRLVGLKARRHHRCCQLVGPLGDRAFDSLSLSAGTGSPWL